MLNVGENVEKLDHSVIGGNGKWNDHAGRQFGSFL